MGEVTSEEGSGASRGDRVKSTAIRQPISVSTRPLKDRAVRELFSLEFQQVAVDLVIYVRVVFLLAQV